MRHIATGPAGEAVTDSFYFVHQPLAGNGSITAASPRCTAPGRCRHCRPVPPFPRTQPWAKAGILIKASDKPGSPYAAMMVTGDHGVRMQYDFTHDIAGPAGAVSVTNPRWLRLTRSGDTLTGYASSDGTHWTRWAPPTSPGCPPPCRPGCSRPRPTTTGERRPSAATTRGRRVHPGHRRVRPREPAGPGGSPLGRWPDRRGERKFSGKGHRALQRQGLRGPPPSSRPASGRPGARSPWPGRATSRRSSRSRTRCRCGSTAR